MAANGSEKAFCVERTRLSCWCLYNHKGYTYRAPVRYVTKTWSVVLLNKKIHILLSQVYCVWQVVKTLTIIFNNPVLKSDSTIWTLCKEDTKKKTMKKEHILFQILHLGRHAPLKISWSSAPPTLPFLFDDHAHLVQSLSLFLLVFSAVHGLWKTQNGIILLNSWHRKVYTYIRQLVNIYKFQLAMNTSDCLQQRTVRPKGYLEWSKAT